MTGFRLAVNLASMAPLLFLTGGIAASTVPPAVPSSAGIAVPAQTPATQSPPGNNQSSDRIQINYDHASLTDFVAAVGLMLGITPIQVDPEVTGTVTIRTAASMPKEALQRLFEGVLKNNNAVLRKSGEAYRVVKLEAADMTGAGASSPPKPPQREPVRVSGDVQESKLICRLEPVYPDLARRARVTGTSLLEVTINEQGEVATIQIIRSGHPLLPLAAVDAVKLWLYSPTYIDGVAVPVITTVAVPFELRNPERFPGLQVPLRTAIQPARQTPARGAV